MVLYTVDSLLLPGNKAIIGLTSGDCTYDILGLLCNTREPILTSVDNVSYFPEPAGILTQCACLSHLQHGTLKGKSYIEMIAADNIETLDIIQIDTQAGSWVPTQEKLLLCWMNYISNGLNDLTPYAYTRHKGSAEALAEYMHAIAASKQNALFISTVDGHTAICGFRCDDTVYTASSVLTNNEAYKKLVGLLGVVPLGYICTRGDNLCVYVAIDDIYTHTLCIPVTATKGVSTLAVLSDDECFRISTAKEDIPPCISANFKNLLGEPADVNAYMQLSNPHIYTKTTDKGEALFAVYSDGQYFSLYDICRLQASYDKVTEILGVKDIPCYVQSGLKFWLILTDELLSASNVVYKNYEALMHSSETMAQKLQESFDLVSIAGLPIEDITSKITLPTVRTYALTHFGILRGDFEGIEEYNTAYSKLNPILTNEIQNTPTSVFSRALPSYQQLSEIYNSEDKDDSDGEGNDSVPNNSDNIASTEATTDMANTTQYFQDDLAGVEQSSMSLTDYSQLDMNINLTYMPLATVFKYFDCVHYKNALAALGSTLDPVLIEGSANNNTLPIQDNELKFYLGLRNLVIYGICVENKIFTMEGLEAKLAAGVHSLVVDAFLRDLAEDIYSLNWVHTGHVLADTSATSANDDGEDDTLSVSIPGRYFVEIGSSEYGTRQEHKVYEQFAETEFLDPKSRLAGFQSGMPRIDVYARTEIKNPFTWIEIVVRLSRWGARKPNSLYVPSLNEATTGPRFLNMQTLTISGFSGTFVNLQKNTYGEHEDVYLVDSEVILEVSDKWASDLTELNANLGTNLAMGDKIPCSIALTSTFANLPDKQQYFYVDVFTLATQIAKGQIGIYGLSYDTSTEEFICGSNLEPVFDSSGDTVLYDPKRSFEENKTELPRVLNALKLDPIVYTQSKCAFLVKYLRVLDEKLSNFKTNTISILDLLRLCATQLNWDCISECEQLMSIMNNDERRDKAAQIRTVYQLPSTDEILKWIVFTEAVKPFMLLAERMRDKPKTLCSVLKEALAVQAEIDSGNSTARSTHADQTVNSFSALFPKCIKHYKFTHPITGEDICYAGIVDSTTSSKILIGLASEVTQLPNVQFETHSLPVFYKEWILPIIPYYKAAASQPKDMTARKQFQAQLAARFIQATPQTFNSILKTCIEVSKQQKAQR